MDARQRWTLILTSVASLMVGLDLTVVTTALNTIRLDLGASIAELDWTINAYTLTIGVLLLTAAAVGDRLGRRRVLVAGLAVFTASSAACALAPSGFTMTAAMMSGVVFFVQYLQASLGEGPLAAGVRLLPLTATLFVVAPIAGRFVARLGERPIVVVGMLGQTPGLLWIALSTGGSYPALIPGMVLTGVGVSAAMPAAQNAAISSVSREAIGTASGVYNAMRQVGGAFGIAIASAVFAAAGGFASPRR
jgi:MFS family permease